jgi:hypothetical protein
MLGWAGRREWWKMRLHPLGLSADNPAASSADRSLRALMLPPSIWGDSDHNRELRPDFERFFRCVAADGVQMYLLNPCGRPWNPFSG